VINTTIIVVAAGRGLAIRTKPSWLSERGHSSVPWDKNV